MMSSNILTARAQEALLESLKLKPWQKELLNNARSGGQQIPSEHLTQYLTPEQLKAYNASVHTINEQVNFNDLASNIGRKVAEPVTQAGEQPGLLKNLESHAERVLEHGQDVFASSSRIERFGRGASIGLGAAVTIHGLGKMLTGENHVAEDGTVTRTSGFTTRNMLEIAAGVGIVAAASLLRLGSPGAAR